MRQLCLLTFLLCFHAAPQAAKLMVVMQSSNMLFHLIYTCAAVFLLPSSEFKLTELLHFTASVMSRKMICSDMSPHVLFFMHPLWQRGHWVMSLRTLLLFSSSNKLPLLSKPGALLPRPCCTALPLSLPQLRITRLPVESNAQDSLAHPVCS